MTYEFYAKIYFIDNTIDLLEVFHYGLDSFKPQSIPISEWVRNYLEDYSVKDLKEVLNIPQEGDYQVIFKGTIDGYENQAGEWEEDMSFLEKKQQPIPPG